MKTKFWVGGVKSTFTVRLLEEAFGRFGKVCKAETGFPGFGFVEFEDGIDASEAQERLDKTVLNGIGKIHVSQASLRGYEEACRKRDDYWRAKGYEHAYTGAHSEQMPRRSARSRGRASSSSSRRSRARSGSQRSRSSHRSRSARRGPKKERRSRSRSPSHQSRDRQHSPDGLAEEARAATVDVGVDRGDDVNAKAGNTTVQEHRPVWLSDVDRANILCFFDGATPFNMLVEGASISKAHNPERMPKFPRAFPDVDKPTQASILQAMGCFGSDAKRWRGGERSVEVRQSIIVDADGISQLRKTLVVDGSVCFSEDKSL